MVIVPKDWTVRQCEHAKPGVHRVSRNLYLDVAESGSRSWLMRYKYKGRQRTMGLGSFDVVPLAEARDKVIDARRMLRKGIDPLEHKRDARAGDEPKPKGNPDGETFKALAETWLAQRAPEWCADHVKKTKQILRDHAYPKIGNKHPREIDTAAVLDLLEPIWTRQAKAPSVLRSTVERVLDYAKAHGLRDGENPARWRGHLAMLLTSPRKLHTEQHFGAVPYEDIPSFMVALHAQHDADRARKNALLSAGVLARRLEFQILTAARPGEVAGARWSEIDEKARLWILPPHRHKNGRKTGKPHKVPLSDRALAILAEMAERFGRADYVFKNEPRAHKPTARAAGRHLLLRMGIKAKVDQHGFRSSFKDWASEITDHPDLVSEMALAHMVGDDVERAYRRGDLLAKRRALMDDWAAYCLSKVEQPELFNEPVAAE